MPATDDDARPIHWTATSAKWFAAGVLGAGAVFGVLRAQTPVPGRAPIAPTAASSPAPPLARVININTASQAELELLPAIGPVVARRIIEDRSANGRYPSLDALDRVKGIGPKTIERLRSLACAE